MTKYLTILFSLFISQQIVAQNMDEEPLPTSVNCGQTTIKFTAVGNAPSPNIGWVQVHENESSATEAAKQIWDSLGYGQLIYWQTKGERNIEFTLSGKKYSFDPNRIYTQKGVEATLENLGATSKQAVRTVKNVGQTFVQHYVDNKKLIVAMHNNTDNGGLHILSYQKGGVYQDDASKVYVNGRADIDDFFYTTSPVIFDYLSQKGFNILLQNNITVTDDGSLSVYCSSLSIPYVNIEAEHGHVEMQKTMMLAVLQMIKDLEFDKD